MPAIVKELSIAASPQSIFDALTKPDEIVRWWPDEAQVRT